MQNISSWLNINELISSGCLYVSLGRVQALYEEAQSIITSTRFLDNNFKCHKFLSEEKKRVNL